MRVIEGHAVIEYDRKDTPEDFKEVLALRDELKSLDFNAIDVEIDNGSFSAKDAAIFAVALIGAYALKASYPEVAFFVTAFFFGIGAIAIYNLLKR